MTETDMAGNIRAIWEATYVDSIMCGPAKIYDYYPNGKIKKLTVGKFVATDDGPSELKGRVHISEWNSNGKLIAKGEVDY
jgi:hypothetical protein